MELSRDLLFFFSALGAFNSLILGIYFLVSHKRHPATYFFLSLILLLFSVRVGVSCLYYFGDIPRQLIKLGLGAHLLLGPALYYFVRFNISKKEQKWKWPLIHIGLLAAALVYLAFAYHFYDWDYNIRYTIHGLLTLYLAAAAVALIPGFKALLFNKKQPLDYPVKEAVSVYLAVVFICLGFVISLYTNYILGPLIFSTFFYSAVGYRSYLRKRVGPKKKYRQKLDPDEVAQTKANLKDLMEHEKPFKDPEFSLAKLARKLSVSRHFLSQMLNDNMNVSYADLINQYRIEEACRLIEQNVNFKLEGIGYEVGFNAKSSFYTVFKKIKGVTPSKFRAGLKV